MTPTDYAPRTVAAVAAGLVVAMVAVAVLGPQRDRFDTKVQPRAVRLTVHPAAGAGGVGVPAVPPEVAAARDGWPLPNGDYANDRQARGAAIRASNVSRLGVAWALPLRAASKWGDAASGPLILGTTVYFQDLLSNVWAIDLKSGQVRWVHTYDQKAFGPNGPAVGWGKVFAQDGRHNLAALDIRTGRQLWQAGLAGPSGQEQPVPFGGLVYTGIAAGLERPGSGKGVKTALLRGGASGYAYGIDEDSGRVRWQVQTVQHGFWGNPRLNGGAGIWSTPAVDPATGETYWSTGNPGPAPGTRYYPNASSRPGPNLYSNSVLALDGESGHRDWYYQALPHDIFHHDLQNAPILVKAGGRELVITSGKMGVVYAVDRLTGKLVWKRAVGVHRNDMLKRLPPSQ